MKIKYINPELLHGYANNAKEHTEEQVRKVAESIKRFGFVQPIVADKNNEIIIGHCRQLASVMLGLEGVPVLYVDNLTEEEVKALRIADNKLNESAWNMELVIPELDLLSKDLVDLIGFDLENEEILNNIEGENIYTKKIVPPVYEPKNEKPLLEQLFDDSRAKAYLVEIENSKLSKEEKEFLKLSAYRLVVFNYDKIADFYAHSEGEIKDLIEKLALVIIDFDKAIENGYVKVCDELFTNLEEDYEA